MMPRRSALDRAAVAEYCSHPKPARLAEPRPRQRWKRRPSYVYAIGRIEPRFPRLSVEKEFAQATGRAETAGLTDRQALQKVLSKPAESLSGSGNCAG